MAGSTAQTFTKSYAHCVDPFKPLSTHVSESSPSNTSQIITLPSIPELHDPNFLDILLPPPENVIKVPTPTAPTNALMTALREDFGNRALTENQSPAYASTLNSSLDFFSAGPAQLTGPLVHTLLSASWEKDPDLTLRLIFYLRSIHDGRGEKSDSFLHAYGWLYKHHPRTAIANLQNLVDPIIDRPAKKSKGDGVTASGKQDANENEEEWTDISSETAVADAEQDDGKKDIRLGYAHGYYKDLLNILLLAALGELTNPDSSFSVLHNDRPGYTRSKKGKAHIGASQRRSRKGQVRTHGSSMDVDTSTSPRNPAGGTYAPETPAEKKAREAKQRYDTLVSKLGSPAFRALYIAVARIFASKLAQDIGTLLRLTCSDASNLSENDKIELKFQISLAAKWAPSLGASHDRHTNIATAIASILHGQGFMSGLPAEYTPSTLSAADAETIRGYYRRWIMAPLRRYTLIPETFMSEGNWSRVVYGRVPAGSMKMHKSEFARHDNERFTEYIKDVVAGKRKIAGGTLLPHELLSEAMVVSGKLDDPIANVEKMVIESQWKALVDKVRESGTLDNCLAVCDVSGSMGFLSSRVTKNAAQQPIYPAVALSLLLAQLARPPFANTFITFSATPQLFTLDPSLDLVATAEKMGQAAWGMNTDFLAVFLDLLLPLAIKHKIKKEDMIKRLFVFSDMQFDDARLKIPPVNPGSSGHYEIQEPVLGDWITDHQRIVQAYKEAGYDVPELVYWNLGGYGTTPVLESQEGCSLIGGFSPNMLKLFMEEDEEVLRKSMEEMRLQQNEAGGSKAEAEATATSGMNPVETMMKALTKKSFDVLKVLD
ncbi:hypothetical protein POSPLADRAFT_1072293 [Postia placenta MAD-698-R-SB12]|uniref:TROVE domain-containing protein n=1 Tax=Postia placenta MAD-698-R-SB12 TaxID=670580 RepID=A0A1X6NFB4_9APHY|nr:hypothetical protein POSPLADRAFT_1072293 [Postia placenta MAD-698-R-SB12]OSX67327.1 hypothetical protein POSPLADRAFT_1072293 [Postia placenta MAD-698-R-SB12]